MIFLLSLVLISKLLQKGINSISSDSFLNDELAPLIVIFSSFKRILSILLGLSLELLPLVALFIFTNEFIKLLEEDNPADIL